MIGSILFFKVCIRPEKYLEICTVLKNMAMRDAMKDLSIEEDESPPPPPSSLPRS